MKIEIDNPNHRRLKKYKPNNAIWSVLWRFLLVCAIFDGGIYFYFHKIQNITVAEGIRRIRYAIHGDESSSSRVSRNVTHDDPEDMKLYFVNANSSIVSSHHTNISHDNSLNNVSRNKEMDNKIYCWEDEKGIKHFSNTGYPADGYFKIINL